MYSMHIINLLQIAVFQQNFLKTKGKAKKEKVNEVSDSNIASREKYEILVYTFED